MSSFNCLLPPWAYTITFAANSGSALLSTGASAFIVVIWLLTKQPESISNLIYFLTLADFGASLGIILSQTFLWLDFYSPSMCIVFRCLIQFFFVASFLWTCCIAHHLYRETKLLSKIKNPPMLIYHVLCWGISASIVAVVLLRGKIQPSTQKWCHLEKNYELMLWILPMAIALIWNIVFYILILKHLFTIFNDQRYQTQIGEQTRVKRGAIKKLSLLLLVFVVCWALDAYNHLAQYFFNICPSIALVVIQDTLTPLQGFLNSIVYGLSNADFQSTTKRVFSCNRKRDEARDPLMANF